MKKVMARILFIVLLLPAASTTLSGEILKVEVDGVIDPITAEFIQDAVRNAQAQNAEMLLIRLATPGGLGISMQEIVQSILNSNVPVVCFVSPPGAHAASAGFFILLAADVAAMAPGTNTGSAHPVFPFGMDNEVMLDKVRNDALANLRSIVQRRERNNELAQQAVLESKSFTAQEALEGNLIDLVAENEEDLLARMDGMEIRRFDGSVHNLRTSGQIVRTVEKTFRQQILTTIANPNLALILGIIGVLGLYLEFSSPGLILPGVFGGICFLLSLLGFSLLPVTLIGVLLILLAIGLFIAESLIQGFGVLGAGGIVSMILGIIFLIDSPYPALRIDWGVAVGVALPFALISIILARLAIRSFRSRVTTGEAGFANRIATAHSDIDERGGTVRVQGEIWNARSSVRIEKGSRVRIVRAKNLDLLVEPIQEDNRPVEKTNREMNQNRPE